jgi:hypothetical protein
MSPPSIFFSISTVHQIGFAGNMLVTVWPERRRRGEESEPERSKIHTKYGSFQKM